MTSTDARRRSRPRRGIIKTSESTRGSSDQLSLTNDNLSVRNSATVDTGDHQFGIPRDLQVQFPHLWYLNDALQNVYKERHFPRHIDLVQVLKNFFRSNALSNSKAEHMAVKDARYAMNDLYERSLEFDNWRTACSEELSWGTFKSFPYHLSPSLLLAAFCVYGGGSIPQDWDHCWEMFGWMLQDPATWPDTMPKFWKGSQFDQAEWIADFFKSQTVSNAGVPPEITEQPVNSWFHPPRALSTRWNGVLAKYPKFPCEWWEYLNPNNSKLMRLKAPRWIREAPDFRPESFLVSDSELDHDLDQEEEDDTDPELNDGEGIISAIPRIDMGSPGPYCIRDHSARESSHDSRNSPLHVVTRTMARKRRHEEEVNSCPWASIHHQATETLSQIAISTPEQCLPSTARSADIIKDNIWSLKQVAELIDCKTGLISKGLADKEVTINRLLEESSADKASLEEAKQVKETYQIWMVKLESELEASQKKTEEEEKEEEEERVLKRRRRLPTPHQEKAASISPQQQNQTTTTNSNEQNSSTNTDLEILKAAYTENYQTPNEIGSWKSYKRTITKLMPIWNGFPRTVWEGGFSDFKKALRGFDGLKLPKDDALRRIFEVEYQAREDMECWNELFDAELPKFDPRDVFGEE